MLFVYYVDDVIYIVYIAVQMQYDSCGGCFLGCKLFVLALPVCAYTLSMAKDLAIFLLTIASVCAAE